MAFNGAGVFVRLYNWVTDAANGINIRADRMDAEMDGFASGLSQCLTRDGQAAMTANLKMGGFGIVNLKDPEADQDAATRKFVNDRIQAVVKPTISDTAPANPVPGDMWYRTSNPVGLYVWVTDATSGAWKIASGETATPAGAIIMWSGVITALPVGWKLCDGTNGTPDLRNRFIVGAGGEYSVNDVGGAKEVTLTEAQLPAHTHGAGSLSAVSGGSHTHNVKDIWPSSIKYNQGGSTNLTANGQIQHGNAPGRLTDADGAHTHTISGDTGSKGGGTAHENRPPYYALAYIMKN